MSLTAGARLGAYQIGQPIGAGGMGEVYRATDTVLDREVAVKILPESFAEDTDRAARFRQEAKTLASLNHVNIAQIYGLEESDGIVAIIMELVEGPTLAERIERGSLAMDGAIGIAMQIIAALEAAHERGIVHRDLKPANIKLRSDGVVKVLDFGIAKAYGDPVTSTDSQPAVLTTPVTQTGIILGTAAYMSPEQARGLPIDQRADIWAFGCVLYEMLTGQSAFGGEDVPMTLARVLAQDTDIKSLPATISPAVRQTLRVCLRKELSERVADIRDVRLALEGAFEADVAVRGAALESPRASWRRRLGISVALLSSAAIAGFGGWSLRTTPDPALVRSLLTPPESARYTPTSADPHLAITSDGSRVVYVGQADGRQRIFVRDLARLEASTLTDLTTLIRSVFVSFDGSEVGYSDGSALYRVPIVGGQPEMITDALDGFPRGAAWGPDGTSPAWTTCFLRTFPTAVACSLRS
jgi:serine/threonine protein kinase